MQKSIYIVRTCKIKFTNRRGDLQHAKQVSITMIFSQIKKVFNSTVDCTLKTKTKKKTQSNSILTPFAELGKELRDTKCLPETI